MNPARLSASRARTILQVCFFAVTLPIVGIGPAVADSWTGTLQDGSVLKVDPATLGLQR